MKYLKYFEAKSDGKFNIKGKIANLNTNDFSDFLKTEEMSLEDFKKLRSKLNKLFDTLGFCPEFTINQGNILSYDIQIDFNLNSVPYSIVNLMTQFYSKNYRKAEQVLLLTANGSQALTTQSIKISSKLEDTHKRTSTNVITTSKIDVAYKKIIRKVIESINSAGENVTNKDRVETIPSINSIIMMYLGQNVNSKQVIIPQDILDIINNKLKDTPNVFGILNGIKKDNTILFKLLNVNKSTDTPDTPTDMDTAADMGEMGF